MLYQINIKYFHHPPPLHSENIEKSTKERNLKLSRVTRSLVFSYALEQREKKNIKILMLLRNYVWVNYFTRRGRRKLYKKKTTKFVSLYAIRLENCFSISRFAVDYECLGYVFAIWIWCVSLICRTNLAWSFTLFAGVSTREKTSFPKSYEINSTKGRKRGGGGKCEMRHNEIIEILWNVRRWTKISFVFCKMKHSQH